MFRIVFICTGNQARSVIGERYMRRAIEGLPVTVDSGGILDLPPGPALPKAIAAAKRLGVDLGDHRSRCLIGMDFSDADLVLGFEQKHVASAVVDGGADVGKTFRIAEFLRLLTDVTVPSEGNEETRARSVVRAAHRQRLASNAFVAGEELRDPAGRDERFFDQTARSIATMCDELVDRLFGHEAAEPRTKEAPEGAPY